MAEQREEELDILSSSPPAGQGAVEAGAHNHIDVSVPDLSSLSRPGQTNEEFVANLLQAPQEQMIPWEECWLPSKGLYYGWPDGLVKVRAMGSTAEKILATQRLAQTGQSIDYLFRECCQFPSGFDPVDLLLGDRIFMLYFIRGITHGHLYEFAISCPECMTVSTHSYDLNELATTINWAKPELGPEPFKVVLPCLSKATKRDVWVGVRFLRASDSNAILAQRKARKNLVAKPGVKTRGRGVDPREQARRTQEIDESISQNMEKIIVNIMGTGDGFQIRQFVGKMHALDSAEIREWLRVNTPGIDNTVTVTCPDCSHEFTVELPITESFFRPAKAGGIRP